MGPEGEWAKAKGGARSEWEAGHCAKAAKENIPCVCACLRSGLCGSEFQKLRLGRDSPGLQTVECALLWKRGDWFSCSFTTLAALCFLCKAIKHPS